MNILYVEDNPFDADLTRRELARIAPDFRLETVRTHWEALVRLGDGSDINLVLTDLRLPDGDGLSLLSHIRHLGLPIAVVIITGQGNEGVVVAALKAGADDYVVKSGNYLERLPALLQDAWKRFQRRSRKRERRIYVLYAETNAENIKQTREHLLKYAPHIGLETAMTAQAALQKLAKKRRTHFNLLLLDYRLPGLGALDLLKEIRQVLNLQIPVILISDQGMEEQAIEALRLGAADYLVKNPGYLYRLPTVLENAYYRSQLLGEQAALNESKEFAEKLIAGIPDGLAVMNKGWKLVNVNPALSRITGFPRHELLDSGPPPPYWPIDSSGSLQSVFDAAESDPPAALELNLVRKDGSPFPALVSPSTIENESGETDYFLMSIKDISHLR